MKPIRLAFVLALMGAAACSSPTEPRLPQPLPDDEEEPPQTGMAPTVLPVPVSFATWA